MLTSPDRTICADWQPITARAWRGLTDKVDFLAHQQDYGYGEMISRVGGSVKRVVLRDGDGPLAVAQIQERSIFGLARIAMVMMGPVWLRPTDDATRAAALSALAKDFPSEGRTALLVMPADANDAPFKMLRAPRMVSSYHTAILDLSPPLDQVRAAMKGKWRNRLVAAEKAPLDISAVPARPESYQWLLDRETEQRKRQRYSGLPVGMVPAYQDAAGRDSIVALVARTDGVDVAGCLFLRHGPTATYHIGWSSPDGRALNAHNRLLWTAAERLKAKGVRSLDLGGLTDDRDEGLVRFKLGSGAKALSQAGTFLLRPRWR